MTSYGTSDLATLFGDSGVSVTVGSTTGRGLLDVVDEELLKGEYAHLAGRLKIVLVRTGEFTLTRKGDITVDSIAYKVHAFAQIDDGALTRVTLVLVN